MKIELWQEVENLQGTISGIVYEIEEKHAAFRDEHGNNYRISLEYLRTCNYMSFEEKTEIINHFKKKKVKKISDYSDCL